jgi:translation initiation factor IF-2
VLGGRIRNGWKLMNANGVVVGEIKEMQKEKEKVEEAEKGMQLAISCEGIYYGKDVCEGEILYTYISKGEISRFENQPGLLSEEEKIIFDEIKKLVATSPFG